MKNLFKNTAKFFLAFLFITLVISCEENNDPEDLFEESSTVRKEQAIEELKNILQAPANGWKVTYFTDDSQLGGYSFLFDFEDNQNVEMISDFSGNYQIGESEYEVGYGATVKLIFTTKNFIHDLSDSVNSPTGDLVGQGYRGDFEFLFYGEENGELLFKTNKFFSDVVLEEATADDWANLSLNENTSENIKNDPSQSVFRTLTVGEEAFNFTYNSSTRFVTSGYGNFGVGFTETGIVVSPAITVNNIEVTNIPYDEASGDFILLDGSGNELVSIKYTDTPSSPITGYEDLNDFIDMNYFFGLDPILDSVSFTNYFGETLANLSSLVGLEITRIVVLDLDADNGDLVLITNFGNFFYSFNKTIVDNKMVLTRTTPADANDAFFSPILDVFFDPLGLYVIKEGTLDDFSNITFSFITASDTSLKYSFFAR